MARSRTQSEIGQMTLKNKKQIGLMPENDKIYIEDYTVTYLSQMGQADEDCLAALFGVYYEEEQKRTYTIYGAIGVNVNWGDLGRIPESAVSDIIAKKREHFSDMFFLGWAFLMHQNARPNMDSFYRSHLESAFGRPRILSLMEAGATECAFYVYTTDRPTEVSGYSIFYTRNDAMQKYLIDWHGETARGLPESYEDDTTDNCRMSLAERKQNRMRNFVSNATLAMAFFLMIVVTCVGITMINQYSKMKEVELTLLQIASTIEDSAEDEVQTVMQTEERSITVSREETGESSKREGADSETTHEEAKLGEGADIEPHDANEPQMTAHPEPVDTMAEVTDVIDSEEEEVLIHDINADGVNEYIVVKGDTLNRISKQFYGSVTYVEEICELNGIEDKNAIFYGQKIRLPQID